MNALLVAAVLIFSLALVRADKADEKLLAVLNSNGFNVVVMPTAEEKPLKEAMDAGKGVSNDILSKFVHVFYYTTDEAGTLKGPITQRTGSDELILPGAKKSAGDNADNVFMSSLDKAVVQTALKTALKRVQEGGKFKACVESGEAENGLYHHVLAFAATE